MPMTQKLTIAFTRREAELYRSHGLVAEARQLYQQVLDGADTLGPDLAAALQEKVRALEDQLSALDTDLAEVVSERELSILRQGWGDAQSTSDIATCAAALGSIGLFEAAIEEYRRLLRLGRPRADYLQGLTNCLLAVYDPQTIAGAIETIIARDQPEGAHPTGLRIAFAMELARREVDRPALALCASARAIRPLPDKIERLVGTLTKRLQAREALAEKEASMPPGTQNPAYALKIRLASRLARLRALIRRLGTA